MKTKTKQVVFWGVSQDFFFMHRAYGPELKHKVKANKKSEGVVFIMSGVTYFWHKFVALPISSKFVFQNGCRAWPYFSPVFHPFFLSITLSKLTTRFCLFSRPNFLENVFVFCIIQKMMKACWCRAWQCRAWRNVWLFECPKML